MIANAAQLSQSLSDIKAAERVAIDTEADSLHCYREKLCLLQVSVAGKDFVVDPLATIDLAPLCLALADKEIVLHGADFDLRLLRRSLDFVPKRIFDTVIAARLVGIREFSLAALVKRFCNVDLAKGSQKANWARRPLSARMVAYAINDTHYLLGLATKLEEELNQRGRVEWFRQSCRRALELSAIDRTRVADEAWRISGAGALRGPAAAVLRELWNWRERQAEAVDRPPFHILQNSELISAAESFANGGTPDFRHFSPARRHDFREAAERGLCLPEKAWPVIRRRTGQRPTADVLRRTEEIKLRRDRAAIQHDLEPTFIASRSTIETIAADETRATELLVPWQRDLLSARD
ncbi:MAG TPA: ribonuclease D [Chthoniobacterales bacterium]|nr:ribonuclease D [Chthoniobacterales bacterium]